MTLAEQKSLLNSGQHRIGYKLVTTKRNEDIWDELQRTKRERIRTILVRIYKRLERGSYVLVYGRAGKHYESARARVTSNKGKFPIPEYPTVLDME